MEPAQIVERVWPGHAATFEPLGGGITNHNFQVEVGGETFVLRIGGEDTQLLGIDRESEHAASRVAAELGLAPEVVAFVEPEGYLVTRFVVGEVGRVDVPQVGAALRRLHDGPAIPSRFDSFRVVETYRAIAEERGVVTPSHYGWASEIAGRIEDHRRAAPILPCHNDLLNANFIGAEGRLWIVDWEYAGMGDPFFDLGNFAVNHELDADGEQALLESYESGDGDVLTLMRFMSDFREAMWGVVQQAISTLEFDFVAYADEHFERLERTAADPRFRAALG
ncbi:MAG TPA: choline/ethanolamine kinase family protein [Gaiellaceae bacterium]|nr:choline/ethanolamine kinase family protein [Gaiellaceae bacterium]